jgi:signal peptidase II
MPSAGDRRPGLYLAAAGLVLVLDRLTKAVVSARLEPDTGLPVWGDWFQLRLTHNPGAAFGIHVGAQSRWIFLVLAAAAIAFLTGMARRTPAADRFRLAALGLVSGGAAGNLVDRIVSPAGVIDFLDVGIGLLRWPTFNVADIGVSCGAVALAVSFWLEDQRRGVAPA